MDDNGSKHSTDDSEHEQQQREPTDWQRERIARLIADIQAEQPRIANRRDMIAGKQAGDRARCVRAGADLHTRAGEDAHSRSTHTHEHDAYSIAHHNSTSARAYERLGTRDLDTSEPEQEHER